MPKRFDKTFVKESTIPEYGQGLFAKVNIKKGCIIAEFKGRLLTPKEYIKPNKSVVRFNDNTVLYCHHNNNASYANDGIMFPKQQRCLLDVLQSNEPFYKKYADINAALKINDKQHRAYLIAIYDIHANQEIFTHYGFLYWFGMEASQFTWRKSSASNVDLYKPISEYPGFIAYVSEFYPLSHVKATNFTNVGYDIYITTLDNTVVIVPFKYSYLAAHINIDTQKNLLTKIESETKHLGDMRSQLLKTLEAEAQQILAKIQSYNVQPNAQSCSH